MTDNVVVSANVGIGATVATDDIGGVQHQRVKIVIGADGVSDGDVAATNPMPVRPYGDFYRSVSSGLITGFSVVGVFGSNPDVDTGTVPESIWAAGGVYIWQTAAQPLNIVSSSANDDGAPTSNTGAQTLLVTGLNSNFDQISEVVTLNGTTSVATIAAFVRVFEAYVDSSGTYDGTNLGSITATFSSSGNPAFTIPVGAGRSTLGFYTVPRGYGALLYSYTVTSDKNATIDLQLRRRDGADDTTQPYSGAWRNVLTLSGVDQLDRAFTLPIFFEELTDVEWRVTASSANNTSVSINFNLMLVQNGL